MLRKLIGTVLAATLLIGTTPTISYAAPAGKTQSVGGKKHGKHKHGKHKHGKHKKGAKAKGKKA